MSDIELHERYPLSRREDITDAYMRGVEVGRKMGRGTCRFEERYGDWYCTGCGEMVGTCDPTSELCIDGNAIELWNYCPSCGREVVDG